MEKELLVEERNIMLEARQVCYDQLLAFAQDDMLGRRLAVADSMLAICEKRMQNGSYTVGHSSPHDSRISSLALGSTSGSPFRSPARTP